MTGVQLFAGADFDPPSDTLTCTSFAWAEAAQLGTLNASSRNDAAGESNVWTPLQVTLNTMHRRVCPLYTFDSAKRIQVVGSAVPFNRNGFCFLITASHVCFERVTTHATPLFTMGSEKPRFLSGARIAWDQNAQTPDLDLALIHLPNDEFRDLESAYQFVTPADVAEPRAKTPGIHYIIAGYPATRNRFKSRRFYPSAMATHLMTGDILEVKDLGLPDKSDATHLAIALPYSKVPRLLGGEFNVPKAAGMSGGGIWKVEVDIPRSLATRPLLVGIGIEHHKSRGVFIGTRLLPMAPLANDLEAYVATGIWPDLAGV